MFKRNSYNFESIQNVITYIPTIFILILSAIIIFISYIAIKTKEKKEIDLIKERALLKYEYKKREKLQKFIIDIKKSTNKDIASAKSKLQKVLYISNGYIQRMGLEGKDFGEIVKYLKENEKRDGVSYVLFKQDTLDIYRGEKIILYLKYLIFGSSKNDKNSKLVLKYIYSQGGDNFQYWIDDINNSVKVSFFDKLYIENRLFFLGVFSSLNNLRDIIKRNIILKINSFNKQKEYIWLYDLYNSKVYNYYGNKKNIDVKKILKHKEESLKYQILKYYTLNEERSDKFKNFSYLMDKFKFVISITYDYNDILLNEKENIKKIESYYASVLDKIILVVFVLSLLLIVASLFFAKYVKNVFARYNRKLYLRKESLQHWKKRFELAIIASNDGMWDIDFKKNSIYFSKKWLEISGYDKEDIKDFKDWFGLIHNEDRGRVKLLFDEIFAKKREQLICEYRLKTKNSGYKWILARGKIFKDNNGEYSRMLMMSMDINDTKKMTKELLNVEKLVEDGSITIFKWKNNSNLSVEYVSNSIKNYGYTKKDFEKYKLSYMEIIYSEDKKIFKNVITQAIDTEQKSISCTYRIVDNGGKIRWIYSRILIIKNDMGEVEGFYGYIHDITKLKNIQEELKIKVKEEIEKNREKDAYIIQQNKLASMGSMLGSIAHQWRQPLNNVQLILHFIKDNCSNENFSKEMLKDFIQRAKTQIEYMSQTIDDFRDFYKPSKNKKIFELCKTIEDVLKIIKDQIDTNDINIKFFCKENIIMFSYENELKQSILNILNNAKDAITKKKKSETFDAFISIVIKKVEGKKVKDKIRNFDPKKKFAIISISNNGGKIEEKIKERIFEPYFTTKFETQGTGIGLYMTKIIVEKNLKGKINVKNIKDGVEFEFILPIEEDIDEY